ncbi:hypothetical protein PAMA_011148 [Pampus argenteus]
MPQDRQTNTGGQVDEPEQPALRRRRQTQEEIEVLEEVIVPPGRGQQTQGPPRTRDGSSQVEPHHDPPAPLTTAAVPLDRGQGTRRKTDQQVQTGITTRRTGRQNRQVPPEIQELEDGEIVTPPVLLEPPKEQRGNRGRQTDSGPRTEGGQPAGDVSVAGPPPRAITIQAQVLRDPSEDDLYVDLPTGVDNATTTASQTQDPAQDQPRTRDPAKVPRGRNATSAQIQDQAQKVTAATNTGGQDQRPQDRMVRFQVPSPSSSTAGDPPQDRREVRGRHRRNNGAVVYTEDSIVEDPEPTHQADERETSTTTASQTQDPAQDQPRTRDPAKVPRGRNATSAQIQDQAQKVTAATNTGGQDQRPQDRMVRFQVPSPSSSTAGDPPQDRREVRGRHRRNNGAVVYTEDSIVEDPEPTHQADERETSVNL